MKNLFKKASRTLVGMALVLLVSQIIAPALSTHADGFTPGFNTKPGEADFYKIRNVTKGTSFGNSVQADPKDVLEFSIYFHNSVPYSVARDSRVMANFPAQTKNGKVTTTGFLGSKDAQPAEIQDTAEITADGQYNLTHVAGSTWMKKGDGNGNYPETRPLPNGNQITQERVSIGDVVGGNLEFQGWVYFRMQVGPAEQPQENYSVNIEPDRNGQDYAGREVAYNHTITNTGNVTDSYNISAQSSKGWKVRLSKDSTNPTAPNQSRDLTVWVTIPYGASANDVDSTVITVTSRTRGNVSDRVTDRTTVLERQVEEAELVLSEKVDKTEVQRDNPNESARNITYTMTVTNIGNKAAVNTVLVSDLGDNLEGNANFISYGGGQRDGNNLIYRIGRIGPGQTVEKWFIADVRSDLADGFRLRNRSLVSYDTEGNGIAEPINPVEILDATAWSEYVYTIVRGSGLDLAVTDNRTVAEPGDTLNYKLTLSNTGSGQGYRVIVKNQVPNYLENVRNISDSGIYDASAREITWVPRVIGGNGSHTFTFSADIEAGTPQGTVLVDTATASANNVPSVSASDSTLVQSQAKLNLVEAVDKADVQRDDSTPGANEVTYTLTLSNNGSGPASHVIVRSDLTSILQSATIIDTGGGTISGNELSYAPVDLNVGDAVTFTFRAQVNASAADGAVMTNQSTAEYEVGFPEGVSLAVVRSNTVNTTIHAPFLTLTKTDNKDTTQPGDTSNYEVRIVNTGSGSAYEVNVVDYLPQYLENITDISDGGVYDATTHTITWSNLTVDGTGGADAVVPQVMKVLTFGGEVSTSASHDTILLNRAVLTARNLAQLEATDETRVVAEPVLDLAKTVDVNGTDRATARPGDTLTYTITYGNSGLGAAGNVVLQDRLPQYVTYVSGSATNGGTYNGLNRMITWNLGNLAVGDIGSVSFQVTVNSDVPHNSTIRNRAVIVADGGFSNKAFADILAEQLPALFVQKSVDKTNTKPGDILTYTVRYGNNSPYVSAFNAVLTDDLSGYVTYVSGSATSSGVYNSTNHTLTWNLGTLPPRSSGSVTYQVRVNSDVPNGAIIRNTVTLTASYVDPVRHSVASLSERGVVESTVTTRVSFPGSLTKTGVGLIGLIALVITFLITLLVTSPRFKEYLTRLKR